MEACQVPFEIGSLRLEPIHTPGYTDSHVAHRPGERVFTGDAPEVHRPRGTGAAARAWPST
jgi:hypothetical protein